MPDEPDTPHPDGIVRKVVGKRPPSKRPLQIAWELRERMQTLNLKTENDGTLVRKSVGPSC